MVTTPLDDKLVSSSPSRPSILRRREGDPRDMSGMPDTPPPRYVILNTYFSKESLGYYILAGRSCRKKLMCILRGWEEDPRDVIGMPDTPPPRYVILNKVIFQRNH